MDGERKEGDIPASKYPKSVHISTQINKQQDPKIKSNCGRAQ